MKLRSLVSNKRWALMLSISILIISIIIGSYLRLYPVFNAERLGYKPTLYEMDPYSEYWIAEKLYKHGLAYFNELTRDNHVTKIFWYPWGRDFTKSEPPLLASFSVITYYIAHTINPSLTLYEWMVYLPVLFYIITVIAIYLCARELWGDIPAAVASLASSLIFVSRHIAGFTVKYAIGIPFLFLSVLFHIRAVRRESWIDALLAGLMLSITASGWAGFNLVLGAIAVQVVLLPFIKKISLKDLMLVIIEYVPLSLTLTFIPFYGGVTYLYRSAGLAIPASLLMLLISWGLQKLSSKKEVIITAPILRRYRVIYFLLIVLFIVGGLSLLNAGFIVIRGKALAALGLRGLAHVIVGTVQEYIPADPQDFMYYEGSLIIVTIPMLAYIAYRSFMKREPQYLFILTLYILSLVATINVSYFFAYLNYLTALISASFVYILIKDVVSSGRLAFKRGWFRSLISIILTIIFVIAIIAQGVTVWARMYRSVVPTIIEGGVGLSTDAPVWINALNWIRNNTPANAVCVAWWDYGYWISVVGERPSVADGATLNATQIELLAKALTGSEEEAYKIFTKYFRIDLDKLYLITYEFYYVNPMQGYVTLGPLVFGRTQLGADAAKGISAIYRIAGRTPPVFAYTPQIGNRPLGVVAYLPRWSDPRIQNATLYKILINTAYELWGKNGYKVVSLYENPQNPVEIPRPEMRIFKPVYISLANVFPQANVYLVLSIYKASAG